jgi:hypothetical protein
MEEQCLLATFFLRKAYPERVGHVKKQVRTSRSDLVLTSHALNAKPKSHHRHKDNTLIERRRARGLASPSLHSLKRGACSPADCLLAASPHSFYFLREVTSQQETAASMSTAQGPSKTRAKSCATCRRSKVRFCVTRSRGKPLL